MAICCLSASRIGQFFVLSGYPADTCWLIKTGEIIVRTGSIPANDPFSYTLAALKVGQKPPYVVYQWLTEVVFFCGKYFFDFTGLLVIGAVVMSLGAIVVPLHAGFNTKAPPLLIFTMVACASAGCISRCVLRPELFSLLFLSILIFLLQKFSAEASQLSNDATEIKRFQRLFILLVAMLFLLWCNMHSGFVTGLIILAIYSSSFLAFDLASKRKLSRATKTLLFSTAAATLVSLVNPYNIDLWLYLPHLFLAKVNEYILELRPPNVLFMHRPVYLYYFATLLASFLVVFLTIRKDAIERRQILTPRRLASIVIILSSTIAMFRHSRFISYIVLTALEALNFYGLKDDAEPRQAINWKRIGQFALLDLAVLAVAGFGVLRIANHEIPVLVPSPRANFRPPLAALDYFLRVYSRGRIFSSAEIGSAIELYANPFDSMFVDTRLDGYPMSILTEYDTIINARPGYKDLLDAYKVQWIFVAPTDLIAPVIMRDKSWQVLKKDESALILCRPVLPEQKR